MSPGKRSESCAKCEGSRFNNWRFYHDSSNHISYSNRFDGYRICRGVAPVSASHHREGSRQDESEAMRLKKTALFFAVAMILNLGLSPLRSSPHPPRIEAENSIAELTELELNSRKQWISLRGWDKTKPVLLFLAGGPGGTHMAAVRHELAELEKHFVVVGWDQPGSGKSYYAEKTANITVDTYVQDGHALTEYLKERFSQEKIYLVGESWGSALGIFLAYKYPQSYHALIGPGQMIDFAETERMVYAKALEIA